jgi:hypothetical protein
MFCFLGLTTYIYPANLTCKVDTCNIYNGQELLESNPDDLNYSYLYENCLKEFKILDYDRKDSDDKKPFKVKTEDKKDKTGELELYKEDLKQALPNTENKKASLVIKTGRFSTSFNITLYEDNSFKTELHYESTLYDITEGKCMNKYVLSDQPIQWKCVGSNTGIYEKHKGGHVSIDYDESTAKNNAYNLCKAYHPECHVSCYKL